MDIHNKKKAHHRTDKTIETELKIGKSALECTHNTAHSVRNSIKHTFTALCVRMVGQTQTAIFWYIPNSYSMSIYIFAIVVVAEHIARGAINIAGI